MTGTVTVDGAMEYGAVTAGHLLADSFANISVTANYTISGGGLMHLQASNGGYIVPGVGLTVTLTGTPAFSSAFAGAVTGNIGTAANTYSGSATGSRYSATLNGVINTNGGGATYFPGNSAGSTATGGQYA
jgi:hypothetical protein